MDRCWSLLKVSDVLLSEKLARTVPDLDLDAGVSLCNIFDASYDLRHGCDARLFPRIR
jgi:hypothetical protein